MTKLFIDKDKADDAIKELEDGFGIEIPCIVREEMKTMCNLSEAFFERGELSGVEKNKNDTALRMIVAGKLSYEEIASYTDLTLEEVQDLATKQSA